MSLQKLVAAFDGRTDLPVELPEVRDAIVQLGVQDEIIFRPEAMDPGILKGIYYQYIRSPGVYAEGILTSLVVYTNMVPTPMQRLIGCKELVHVLDKQVEKVRTEEECESLVTKIVGPLASETWDLADFVAWKDRLALYQALMILFPDAARKQAVTAIAAKRLTLQQIAAIASLPEDLASFVLDENWLAIKKDLLDC